MTFGGGVGGILAHVQMLGHFMGSCIFNEVGGAGTM